MQVDPMILVLKPPGSMLLKLRYDGLLSNSAFNFQLAAPQGGRELCRGVPHVSEPRPLLNHHATRWGGAPQVDPGLTPGRPQVDPRLSG